MLIKCKECGRVGISSEAKICPSCGYPIRAVTIEKTNKQWKALKLVSVIAIIFGFFSIFNPDDSIKGFGVLLMLGGILLLIIAKFGAWWHNG